MSVFSSQDKERIAGAISQAEQKTSGEIVVVVANESDDYRFIALMWAALIALTLPLVLIYFPKLTGWRLAFSGPEVLFLIQLALFVVLAFLLQLRAVRFALVPRRVKRHRVRRAAMEQFLSQDLHTTQNRTGVLIFVSLAERQAEIVADDGIARIAETGVWQQAVNELTAEMDASRPADGFIKAIDRCGSVLAVHFPPGIPNLDEHPNHLIELDALGTQYSGS